MATLWYGRKGHRQSDYIGCFETDTDAARAINKRCKELGIPLANPELIDEKPEPFACEVFLTKKNHFSG